MSSKPAPLSPPPKPSAQLAALAESFIRQQAGDRDGAVACSCSAHVSEEEFYRAIRQSAARSERRFEELRTTGHAPDHPASFKEARYLKAIYLEFVKA